MKQTNKVIILSDKIEETKPLRRKIRTKTKTKKEIDSLQEKQEHSKKIIGMLIGGKQLDVLGGLFCENIGTLRVGPLDETYELRLADHGRRQAKVNVSFLSSVKFNDKSFAILVRILNLEGEYKITFFPKVRTGHIIKNSSHA